MELEKILDEMESLIMDATRVPLMDKVMIEEGDLTVCIDKLRSAIPMEVKRAHDLLEEQKNIITNSRAEADRIVEQARAEAERTIELARAEAERMVRNEEVVKMAEERANSIMENAQQYDKDMRQSADSYAQKMREESTQYCADLFTYVEDNLTKAIQNMRENADALLANEEDNKRYLDQYNEEE